MFQTRIYSRTMIIILIVIHLRKRTNKNQTSELLDHRGRMKSLWPKVGSRWPFQTRGPDQTLTVASSSGRHPSFLPPTAHHSWWSRFSWIRVPFAEINPPTPKPYHMVTWFRFKIMTIINNNNFYLYKYLYNIKINNIIRTMLRSPSDI